MANVPIDFFLVDMLVLPLSLAKAKSLYKVGRVTEHLKTNLQIVSQMVGCKYQIEPTKKAI
jgi:RNA 3'-terminal phosphate cyclase